MKNTLISPSLKHLALVFALLLSGCASLFSSKEAEEENTAAVATDMKVKEALIKELDLDAAAIKVDSADNGTVQLSGFADSEALRRKAGQAAAKVPGVAKVTNNIQIR